LKGQILALADNTGRYTTGSHLHFGVKVQYYINGAWVQISQNGYNGAVDPKPFFDDNIDMLPVDRRYGKTFNWLKEFTTRFKTPKIHRALIRRGRAPLSLKNRELNAIVYGGWEIEEILNPALWANWTRDTKSFFKR
jgi:murein DD-endopeptidase MepM/ murein hydrolase activator NlpD